LTLPQQPRKVRFSRQQTWEEYGMTRALAIHNPLSPPDAMAAATMAFEQRCDDAAILE
jgi:hypothetical protein